MTEDRNTTNHAQVMVEQCDREAATEYGVEALGWNRAVTGSVLNGRADGAKVVQAFARHRLAALAALAALASAPAEPLPDIGPDPMKGPRDDDRYEASRLRLRAAYVQQQKGVPDQTALVWRYDLGTVLEMALRLKAITARDEQLAPAPAGDGEALARRFHDTYERLAPTFGYETRPDTKAFDPTSPNGRLMIAVCSEMVAALARPRAEVGEREAEVLLSIVKRVADSWSIPPGPAWGQAARRILALQSSPAKVNDQ